MKRVRKFGVMAAVGLGLAVSIPSVADAKYGETVKVIRDRGELLCSGNNGTYLGFAEIDDKGRWKGFDIELCRAMATAILGSPDKLKIVPVSFAQRFPALQSGELDVIIKVTGWTLGRDTELGLQFSRPYFLGPTQIAANVSTGAETVADLDGGTFCDRAGSSTERIAADYLNHIGIEHKVITFDKDEEMRQAFFSGRCDALVGWGPNLAIAISEAKDASQYTILPDVMAVEPESIAMRQDDDNFVDVANWMLTALLVAEEYGITSENVDQQRAKPANATIERLLGVTPGIGKRLGLNDDWAYNVIKSVGNYQEIYDRTLGDNSPYKLKRGINALIKDDGVMYPLIID